MPAPRAFTSAAFALELEGKPAGRLRSASGGEATADVVSEPASRGAIAGKHLGSVHYSDIELACDEAFTKPPLLTWTQEFLNRKTPRRAGAVSTLDHSGKGVSRRRFTRALLTELAFPALDAASKEPAAISMRVAAESAEVLPGSGGTAGSPAAKSPMWLAANFRLTIDGLDCTRVTRIAPVVVRQPVTRAATGAGRFAAVRPAALEVGDLVVTLPVSHAETWSAWHEDFVINGNAGPEHEKSATLDLMAANRKDVLLTLTLSGLGIYRLVADAQPSDSDAIRRVKASMYCEQVAVTAPGP
jgi:hypothetical protein